MSRGSLPGVAATVLVALAASAATLQADARTSGSTAAKRIPSRDWAYAVALQRDGKIVAAGRSVGGGWRFALARYTARGTLDPSFGRLGRAFTFFGRSSKASAVAIQRDGKLVAAGTAYRGGGLDDDFAVARYTPRGRLDAGFGAGGKVVTDFSSRAQTSDDPFGVAIQADARLVVAGGSGKGGTGPYRIAVARYTTRGKLDPSFGRGGRVLTRVGSDGFGRAVAIQRDRKIVVAGSGRSAFALARYTARGKLDRGFGQGGTVSTKLGSFSSAQAVAIQPDGKIVAAGEASLDFGIVRYTASGKLDRSFGNGGRIVTNIGFLTPEGGGRYQSEDRALAAALQPDGKLVVAGWSDALGRYGEKGCCVPDFALVRYTADGRLDPTFGDGGKVLTPFAGISEAEGVAIQPDGKIVAAGGGAGYYVLARYTPDGKLDPMFGRGGKVQTTLRPAS